MDPYRNSGYSNYNQSYGNSGYVSRDYYSGGQEEDILDRHLSKKSSYQYLPPSQSLLKVDDSHHHDYLRKRH